MARVVGNIPKLGDPWLDGQRMIHSKLKLLRNLTNKASPTEALVLLKALEILEDLSDEYVVIARKALEVEI